MDSTTQCLGKGKYADVVDILKVC